MTAFFSFFELVLNLPGLVCSEIILLFVHGHDDFVYSIGLSFQWFFYLWLCVITIKKCRKSS
jgi:hypothetical protein